MRITVERLEQLLPPNFIRVHRSSIVNINLINEVEPLDGGDHEVRLRDGTQLVLSRRYRDDFKSRFNLG